MRPWAEVVCDDRESTAPRHNCGHLAVEARLVSAICCIYRWRVRLPVGRWDLSESVIKGRTSGAESGGLGRYAQILGGTHYRSGGEQRTLPSICKVSAPQKRMQLGQRVRGFWWCDPYNRFYNLLRSKKLSGVMRSVEPAEEVSAVNSVMA